MKFYPLTCTPISKDRIWGGTKLKEVLNKPFQSGKIGESWEISTVENDVSIISNGIFKGMDLQALVEKYPKELLGEAAYTKYGHHFPLLFKYIDAKTDLSIQVHPNDALAQKRHQCLGKTEMWYVMQADKGARIVLGFKKNTTVADFQQSVDNKKVLDLMEEIPVSKGDVFYLEPGTVHAIGGGIVLAEIQQTSDVTYRVYDWDRVDDNGNPRALHLDLALDAINFTKSAAKRTYDTKVNQSNVVVDSAYFKTNFVALSGVMNYQKKNSFTVFMCTEGQFTVHLDDKEYEYQQGETVLMPAAIKSFEIKGEATLLEISV